MEKAWGNRSMSEVNRVAYSLGCSRYGPRRNNFRTPSAALPTKEQWLETWSKEGGEGGMKAEELDWQQYRKEKLREQASC